MPTPPTERLEPRRLLATTVFTIDPALSFVTLSGEAAGFDFKRQHDGSLRARYDGTIVADYQPGASIRFLGDGDVEAETHGNYDPGDAPGNYAAEVRQLGAPIFEGVVRNLHLDLTSEGLAVAAGGNFLSSGERVHVTRGRFRYDVIVGNDDDFDLAGKEAANSTAASSAVVTGADGVTTLTIPVNLTFKYDSADAEFKLEGQIVATAGPDNGLRPRVDANGSDFGTNYSGLFTTGGAAVPGVKAGAEGLTVSDFDTTTIRGATATPVNRPDGAAEVLAVDTTGTTIAASFNPTTGSLSLTGQATANIYAQVLRTLTYNNTAATPTLGERTILIGAIDEIGVGPAAQSTIDVEEPFNANVVRLGDGESRAVRFRDADGTPATVTLTGGTATVRFEGATQQATSPLGVVTVTGPAAVRLVRIDAADTSPVSKLNVKASGGDGAVTVQHVSVDGPVGALGGKGLTVNGTVDVAGEVGTASFRSLEGASVTATSAGRVRVGKRVEASSLLFTDPFNATVPALGVLAVKGPISASVVRASGSIRTVKSGGLVDCQLLAGVSSTERFPAGPGAFESEAGIGKVTLKAPPGAGAFNNSVIAAKHLGRLNLGLIDTDNAGVAFGVVADGIEGIVGTNGAGQRLRLSGLDDPGAAPEALAATGFTFGDFQVRVV